MRIYRVYTSRNFSHATSMEIHQSQKKKRKKKKEENMEKTSIPIIQMHRMSSKNIWKTTVVSDRWFFSLADS